MHLTGTRSRRRVLRGALFIFAVLTLLACGRAPEPLAAPFDNLPTRVAVAEVPLIVQADFYCGPASLAMVHQWAGLNVTQAEVARQSFTPGAEGTYLADMLGAARRRGQLAVPDEGFENLMREIAAGNPVIVFQNLGLKIAPRWHYGVVVAYDLDVDRIELNSGQHERMVMPVGRVASITGQARSTLTRENGQPTDSNLAQPSSVILLRARTPICASVF